LLDRHEGSIDGPLPCPSRLLLDRDRDTCPLPLGQLFGQLPPRLLGSDVLPGRPWAALSRVRGPHALLGRSLGRGL